MTWHNQKHKPIPKLKLRRDIEAIHFRHYGHFTRVMKKAISCSNQNYNHCNSRLNYMQVKPVSPWPREIESGVLWPRRRWHIFNSLARHGISCLQTKYRAQLKIFPGYGTDEDNYRLCSCNTLRNIKLYTTCPYKMILLLSPRDWNPTTRSPSLQPQPAYMEVESRACSAQLSLWTYLQLFYCS